MPVTESDDKAASSSAAGASTVTALPEESVVLDPVEQIEDGLQRLNNTVADELLTRLHSNDPSFFEQAVLDLLIAMGYGGAEGRAVRTQLSNDGGIDGVIDQDALGLSRIYVQAKRYALDRTVARPDIQAFVGALQGAQASQGVFLTTGRFTAGAVQYAEAIQSRVVLIDGERLARLMIRYGVGVQVERTVAIVRVDEDFFE
ncbi:restriction endonuclease [Corynebacterium variabile]|uniref:restriction endonuclease n=1 Tax=Corynebacterium variabile TaxID=1727 RepID=UPI003FD3FB3E